MWRSQLLALVGVVQMLLAKISPIPEKSQKISGILSASAGHERNFAYSRIQEGLDRDVHHRLVIYGKQVLIRHSREWIKPASCSSC